MKIKLDENLGERGATLFRAAGHDLPTVSSRRLAHAPRQGASRLREPATGPVFGIDRYAGILADLNLLDGVLLSVIPVAQPELLEASGPFWRNARAKGIAA